MWPLGDHKQVSKLQSHKLSVLSQHNSFFFFLSGVLRVSERCTYCLCYELWWPTLRNISKEMDSRVWIQLGMIVVIQSIQPCENFWRPLHLWQLWLSCNDLQQPWLNMEFWSCKWNLLEFCSMFTWYSLTPNSSLTQFITFQTFYPVGNMLIYNRKYVNIIREDTKQLSYQWVVSYITDTFKASPVIVKPKFVMSCTYWNSKRGT